MNKILHIAQREFLATVMTRGFLIGLLLLPAVFAFMFLVGGRLMTQPTRPVEATVGVVDPTGVIASRLRTEYNVGVEIEPATYTAARWLADPATARSSFEGHVAVAVDRLERPVLLFGSQWELQYFERQHPDVPLLAESPVTSQTTSKR